MTKINIQGITDINDPFYRYTMEKLNVIKRKNVTVIDNIEIVCKDLDRSSKILIDYFKKKLGISLIYKNNIISTAADIDYKVFEEHLRQFIERYVLCKKCRLPETILENNNNKITLSCKCCSYVTTVV